MTAPTCDRLICILLFRHGLMGRTEVECFRRLVQPAMTVMDIGSNQGVYTLLSSLLVGDRGKVLAFEPDPLLFQTLQKNLERNGASNVSALNIALGSATGSKILHRSMVNLGDNRLAEDAPGAFRDAVTVPMKRLDDVPFSGKVDFIKIDVQGWELEVLKGMERTLDENQNIQLFIELWPRGLKEAGTEPIELLNWLHDRGFSLTRADTRSIERRKPVADLNDLIPTKGYWDIFAFRA